MYQQLPYKLSSVCCDSVQKDNNTDHAEKSDMCEQEFNDWVSKDHDLQVSTMSTDEETVQCIINQSKEEDGEEENKAELKQIPVSKWQTHETIGILRRLEESWATECEYRLSHSTENSLNRLCANNSKQTKISDF